MLAGSAQGRVGSRSECRSSPSRPELQNPFTVVRRAQKRTPRGVMEAEDFITRDLQCLRFRAFYNSPFAHKRGQGMVALTWLE